MELRKNQYIESLPIPSTKVRKRNKVRVKSETKVKSTDRTLSFYKKMTVFIFLFFITMAILSIAGYIKISYEMNELHNIQTKTAQMEAQRDQWVMKLEPYKDPTRIENIARSSLGMDYPKSEQYITLDLKGSSAKLNMDEVKTELTNKNE